MELIWQILPLLLLNVAENFKFPAHFYAKYPVKSGTETCTSVIDWWDFFPLFILYIKCTGMAHKTVLMAKKKREMCQVMYLEHLIPFGYAWDSSPLDFHHQTHDFVFKLLGGLNSG